MTKEKWENDYLITVQTNTSTSSVPKKQIVFLKSLNGTAKLNKCLKMLFLRPREIGQTLL